MTKFIQGTLYKLEGDTVLYLKGTVWHEAARSPIWFHQW